MSLSLFVGLALSGLVWDVSALYQGDPCSQPLIPGPCRGSFNRYYYNSVSGQCELFTYGGCGGNENNFETLQDCQDTCADDPCNSVRCPAGTVCVVEGDIDCDPSKGPCPLRPLILRCRDICTLPSDSGPCKALFTRYYYNAKLEACQQFNYGGCQGNQNNFLSQEECEDQCDEDNLCEGVKCKEGTECVVVEGDLNGPRRGECMETCRVPADSGPCEALLTRYHYDPAQQLCKSFTYGGCEGNGNNFNTLADCSDTCEKKFLCDEVTCEEGEVCIIQGDCDPTVNLCSQPLRRAQCVSICLLPADTGPCDAAITRWFYDADENQCAKFLYGGCEGNQNNFLTEDECKKSCEGKCPDTSGVITTCEFTEDNCLADSECDPGLLCCPYGCGKRCLKPVF